MNTTRIMFVAAMLSWLLNAVPTGAEEKELASRIHGQEYVPQSDSFPGCTHIAFGGQTEIVTADNRLFF